jgi:hypothetical protein
LREIEEQLIASSAFAIMPRFLCAADGVATTVNGLGPFLAGCIPSIGQKMSYQNHRAASMELDIFTPKKNASIRFL